LFGNGDVQSLSEMVRRVNETAVDGVLVGRAALGAPWFFREKEQARRRAHTVQPSEAEPWTPSLGERFEIVLAHARLFDAHCGRGQFRRMRKHLGWYCKGFPYAAALRARMFHVSSVAEVEAVIADYQEGRLMHGRPAEDPSADESETAHLASRCG
jgi:tRNA-dihydrouridine synthase